MALLLPWPEKVAMFCQQEKEQEPGNTSGRLQNLKQPAYPFSNENAFHLLEQQKDEGQQRQEFWESSQKVPCRFGFPLSMLLASPTHFLPRLPPPAPGLCFCLPGTLMHSLHGDSWQPSSPDSTFTMPGLPAVCWHASRISCLQKKVL